MASNIVFSTLMVLLSKSEQDMEELWNTTGAVNDPSGNKHEMNPFYTISEGNFKSAIVDSWANQSYDSVSVYGTNIFGDTLWESEFNVTGTSSSLYSWFVGDNIIATSSLLPGPQEIIYDDQNYLLRIAPEGSAEKSWFAVTGSSLSYGLLPQVFVPRSPYRPFSNPVYMDDMLGCWYLNDLINVNFMYQDMFKMKPENCIAECGNNYSVAVIVEVKRCYCADINATSPPTDDPSKCYFNCMFTSKLCGGFSSTAGSSYHVQGNSLPGSINTTLLHQKSYLDANNTIQIDISEIVASGTSDPGFISKISVNSEPVDANYTVWYSDSACSGGHMKNLSFDGFSPAVFQANGVSVEVDILKVRCIDIVFSEVVPNAVVELWGPNVTSEHIEASALVIRGKTTVPASSTSSSSTASSSSSTSTSTSSSSVSTSAPPSTTVPQTNTSTSSTTSSGTSMVSSTETSTTQRCFCACNVTKLNLTDEQLQAKILEIQRHLAVNISHLSSTIRKLTSAGDSRPSAVGIGYVGLGILVAICVAIVLIDFALLVRDIKTLFHNIKSRLCPGDEDI